MKKLILFLGLVVNSCAFALANPAATYCVNNGFKYHLIQNMGICIFPDSSYCEEWAYFRGECKPGRNIPASNVNPSPKEIKPRFYD